MSYQVESDSACDTDYPEYEIGESFSIGDFLYVVINQINGIYEAELLRCKNQKIQSVVLPEYITTNCKIVSIGNPEFSKCASLKYVPMSPFSTDFSGFAFNKCTSLTSVTIPDSVTSIGESAFHGCTSLTSVTIPDSVTSIGWSAFDGCTSLISVTIPDGVTSLSSAFSRCTSLNSVIIPDSVTSIGDYTFSGCTSLNSVIIPDSVTSIGAAAFSRCTSLTSVTIPASVTSIGPSAFSECTSLTSVTIPDSVTSIGDEAFRGCASLTSVTIPASVTSIGDEAFRGCASLCKISVDPNNEYYLSESDVLFNKDKTELIFCSRCKKGTYLIPETVKIINCDAFGDCSELKAIVILSKVREIKDLCDDPFIRNYPFYGCHKLEQIIVSEKNAFYSTDDSGVLFNKKKTTLFYCPSGLSGDYILPDTVKTMYSGIFENCYKLKSITMPSSKLSVFLSFYERTNCIFESIFYKEDGITEVEPGNFGGFRYVFDGEKFIRDSAIVKYTVDGVEHTDYIKLKKE